MIRNTFTLRSLLIVAAIIVLGGCAGGKTFNNYARQGDTVAVATGWNHKFDADNIEVTITPFQSTPITYTAPHPAIRGSVNFYPDPLSGLVLSERLQSDVTQFGSQYANLVSTESTDVGADDTSVNDTDGNGVQGDADGEWDRDWWQTVIFVDLPATMAEGLADITVTDIGTMTETASTKVEIIPGNGSPNDFAAKLGTFGFSIGDAQWDSLARTDHYVVEFSGSTVPAAIEVDLLHDGSGTTPYVVNPTGTIKSLSWAPTDDPAAGEGLKVILTPTRDGEIKNMTDFKFYVAGGLTGVAVNGAVQAFNASGDTVSGVSASVTPGN